MSLHHLRRLFAIAGCTGIVLFFFSCDRGQHKRLTFALPVADWWTAAPFVNSGAAECFRRADIALSTVEVNSGLASKNAVVAGTADVGVCAATPLALAAARTEKLIILATYLRSSNVVGAIIPRDRSSAEGLPQPVAIVPSTISESYLYQYLAARGEQQLLESRAVTELSLRPADIPAALQNGSAKSAVVWEPFLSIATQSPSFTVDRAAPPFEVNLYLITRPSTLGKHRQELQRLLHAIDESCRYLHDNSARARHQLELRFGFPNDFLAPTWPMVEYGIRTDTATMRSEIVREARIAKALHYIDHIPDLDYLFITDTVSDN